MKHFRSRVERVCETLLSHPIAYKRVMGSSAPQFSRPSCAQDWEVLRETIEQLYCRQRRPLREVVRLMAERHGFLATYISCSKTPPLYYGLLAIEVLTDVGLGSANTREGYPNGVSTKM